MSLSNLSGECNKVISAFWVFCRRCHFALFSIVFKWFISFIKIKLIDFRLELILELFVLSPVFSRSTETHLGQNVSSDLVALTWRFVGNLWKILRRGCLTFKSSCESKMVVSDIFLGETEFSIRIENKCENVQFKFWCIEVVTFFMTGSRLKKVKEYKRNLSVKWLLHQNYQKCRFDSIAFTWRNGVYTHLGATWSVKILSYFEMQMWMC